MSYGKYLHKLQHVIERFEGKYIPEPNSGCWIWMGCTNKDGYGRFNLLGKLVGAHRFSLMIYKEQENKNLCVCHTCDNPYCVNPDHLFFATHAENMKDKKSKGRVGFNPNKGEEHYNSKLSIFDVQGVRLCSLKGYPNAKIARMYGVCTETIRNIIRGVTWKHC